MLHILGGDSPNKWWRNRFAVEKDHADYNDLCELVKSRFMTINAAPNHLNPEVITFVLTDKGKHYCHDEMMKIKVRDKEKRKEALMKIREDEVPNGFDLTTLSVRVPRWVVGQLDRQVVLDKMKSRNFLINLILQEWVDKWDD